jgi:hypothetical protein
MGGMMEKKTTGKLAQEKARNPGVLALQICEAVLQENGPADFKRYGVVNLSAMRINLKYSYWHGCAESHNSLYQFFDQVSDLFQ